MLAYKLYDQNFSFWAISTRKITKTKENAQKMSKNFVICGNREKQAGIFLPKTINFEFRERKVKKMGIFLNFCHICNLHILI
jgi:hypothetical protein